MNHINGNINLDSVIEQYDALIIDIWGVIYDGKEPYKGAVEAINKYIDAGKKVVFLSNTPRPSEISHKKFSDWGIDMSKAKIYTSGDAVREQLHSWSDEVFSGLGKKLYHLGAERNEDILSGLKVDVVKKLEEADFVLLTAYMNEGEDLSKHDAILERAKNLDLPIICANPDIKASHGEQITHCAGVFAKKYQGLGGVVHYYGKPDSKVFREVLKMLDEIGIKDKGRIMMIGDTMETDIKGATTVGIDSMLVLTGNGAEIYKNMSLLNEYNFKPTWISPNIMEGDADVCKYENEECVKSSYEL